MFFSFCFYLLLISLYGCMESGMNINGGRDKNKLAQISELLRIDKVNVCF